MISEIFQPIKLSEKKPEEIAQYVKDVAKWNGI